MGKATKWLKGLLGMNKHKDRDRNASSPKDKKRWSFGPKPPPPPPPPAISPANSGAAWLQSEQSKHAIAVAAATAAAADAAVAAARAAAAVVRLTSHGGSRAKERWAAAKIQAVFRGFLARKALRALKGLVKIQALVRGYLVRKRAAATLHSMQALIRAQTAVRTQRARRSFNKENRFVPEHHPRKSIETEFHSKRYDSGYDESPKIVEIDTFKPRSSAARISSRRFNALSEYGTEDLISVSSPLPWPGPTRISVPECQHFRDFEWRLPTAHSTPRLANVSMWARPAAPTTPAKSICGEINTNYSNSPSYMASTQSFSAKLRSHSAPKQRPEPAPKKRLSLNEILAARNSISSVRMHKSYTQFQQEEFQNY